MTRIRLLSAACAALFALTAVACGHEGQQSNNDTATAEAAVRKKPAPSKNPSSPTTDTSGTTSPTTDTSGTTSPTTDTSTSPTTDTSGTTQPAGTTDKFGVTMVYPTKAGGETWFIADDATSDARFNPQEPITRNTDGSWKMKATQVRMGVYTSSGYHPEDIASYNRDVLTQQGYMQSPNDWKNVEITGFVKLNATSTLDDNFAWYARGGRHTDTNAGCEGSAYKGDLYFDGRASWAKESWHVSYDYTSKPTVTSSIQGRWVGFKAVIYNTTVNGKTAVKMESYLNDSGDKVTWKKVFETTDSGSMGTGATHCGASDDAMPITWGGPIATFRWDTATDVDFKWLSVREIQP